MHVIGEEKSSGWDVIPAQFRRGRHTPSQIRLPRLRTGRGAGTRAGTADQERAADRGDGGLCPTAKYAWHLPLYRQAQILLSQGIAIERATLAFWGRLCRRGAEAALSSAASLFGLGQDRGR